MATNPVDVLVDASWKLAHLSPSQVLGTGTVVDTARFRFLLSQNFGVDPRSVHAAIIGEHGDGEVPVWSLVNIAGMHLPEYAHAQGFPHDQSAMDEIFRQTRDAAYRIIEAILRNENTVSSVSGHIGNAYGAADVFLSSRR